MKLKTIIEADITDRRWFWKIENDKVSIYGENAYPTEQAAKDAAQMFLTECLFDFKSWPGAFK